MPFTIPITLDNETHFDQQVATLDGTTYFLEFRWNARETAWYMTIMTEAQEVLMSSIKMVVGVPLGARLVDSRMPLGALQLIDTAGVEDPGETELGSRHELIYFTADEVAAVAE